MNYKLYENINYITHGQILQYFSIFIIPFFYPILDKERGIIFVFSDRIKLLREASKLSQVQLAQKIGVTKQTISNWENDNILPSVEMLIKVCNFFNVSTDYMLSFNDKTYIEVTGLSLEIINHIQQLINDIRNKKN